MLFGEPIYRGIVLSQHLLLWQLQCSLSTYSSLENLDNSVAGHFYLIDHKAVWRHQWDLFPSINNISCHQWTERVSRIGREGVKNEPRGKVDSDEILRLDIIFTLEFIGHFIPPLPSSSGIRNVAGTYLDLSKYSYVQQSIKSTQVDFIRYWNCSIYCFSCWLLVILFGEPIFCRIVLSQHLLVWQLQCSLSHYSFLENLDNSEEGNFYLINHKAVWCHQ